MHSEKFFLLRSVQGHGLRVLIVYLSSVFILKGDIHTPTHPIRSLEMELFITVSIVAALETSTINHSSTSNYSYKNNIISAKVSTAHIYVRLRKATYKSPHYYVTFFLFFFL